MNSNNNNKNKDKDKVEGKAIQIGSGGHLLKADVMMSVPIVISFDEDVDIKKQKDIIVKTFMERTAEVFKKEAGIEVLRVDNIINVNVKEEKKAADIMYFSLENDEL